MEVEHDFFLFSFSKMSHLVFFAKLEPEFCVGYVSELVELVLSRESNLLILVKTVLDDKSLGLHELNKLRDHLSVEVCLKSHTDQI